MVGSGLEMAGGAGGVEILVKLGSGPQCQIVLIPQDFSFLKEEEG